MNLDKYRCVLDEVKKEHSESVNRDRNSKVLIIDSLNTFIRTWTSNPTMDDNGDHIGGIIGFLRSIGSVIRQVNPTRVILVFDGKKGSTGRKKVFDGYKSGRGVNRFRVNRQYPEMMSQEEEDRSMKRQLLSLVDILDYLPITTMIYDGIEADDVIAYITTNLVEEPNECVIVSTDKDFLQLVDSRTTVWSPTKKILYDVDMVFKEYGIYPQNFPIYRAMDGDSSDDIPGIKGCGLSTIIKRFPELGEVGVINLDELLLLCEEKVKGIKKPYKIYTDIIDNAQILRRNHQLMQLKNVDIGGDYKMKIISRFREINQPFDKFVIMKKALEYRLLSNWANFDSWIKETFNKIINE